MRTAYKMLLMAGCLMLSSILSSCFTQQEKQHFDQSGKVSEQVSSSSPQTPIKQLVKGAFKGFIVIDLGTLGGKHIYVHGLSNRQFSEK